MSSTPPAPPSNVGATSTSAGAYDPYFTELLCSFCGARSEASEDEEEAEDEEETEPRNRPHAKLEEIDYNKKLRLQQYSTAASSSSSSLGLGGQGDSFRNTIASTIAKSIPTLSAPSSSASLADLRTRLETLEAALALEKEKTRGIIDETDVNEVSCSALLANGKQAFKEGNAPRAAALFELAKAAAERSGDRNDQVRALVNAGNVHASRGHHAAAYVDYREALTIARSKRDIALEDLILPNVVSCCTALGRAEEALGLATRHVLIAPAALEEGELARRKARVREMLGRDHRLRRDSNSNSNLAVPSLLHFAPSPPEGLRLPRLSSGCEVIDAALGGGFPVGCGLVEICGEAGVGKTQLLLALCLAAQLPKERGGLASRCLYISTEGNFPLARLKEMLERRRRSEARDDDKIPNLENVMLAQANDAQEFWEILSERLPRVLESEESLRLIVIDSIAAIFRTEFAGVGARATEEMMQDRNTWYFTVAAHLKRLARAHGCLVVLANQVSYDLDAKRLKPALGLSWSHCVDHRFVLEFAEPSHPDGGDDDDDVAHEEERTRGGVGDPNAEEAAVRKTKVRKLAPRLRRISVVFSSVMSDATRCYYYVDEGGLTGCVPTTSC